MEEVRIGATATARLVVATEDLASELRFEPTDDFPAVFATARMVALMEVAASRVLRPHLEPGQASVGILVDIVHTAATPPGGTVTATATLVARDAKTFTFEVSARDDAGEIGRGMHRRAVVTTSRLEAGAARRM